VSEEKKGHMKVTVDVEINEALMGMMKECVQNVPQVMQALAKKRRREE